MHISRSVSIALAVIAMMGKVRKRGSDLIAFVDRAVRRGELASRPPATDFLPEVLLSVAITRPLFGRGHADLDYLTRCVDEVLLPMLLPSGSPR